MAPDVTEQLQLKRSVSEFKKTLRDSTDWALMEFITVCLFEMRRN